MWAAPDRQLRIRALVLGALSFGWLPLALTERLDITVTPAIAAAAIALLVTPPLCFILLILLTRRLVRTRRLEPSRYWHYRLLCLFTGPVGCVITVFHLTRRSHAA